MSKPTTVRVYAREAINALIGRPATTCWQTSSVGYDVTAWQFCEVMQTEVPQMSTFVQTKAEADKIARRWSK